MTQFKLFCSLYILVFLYIRVLLTFPNPAMTTYKISWSSISCSHHNYYSYTLTVSCNLAVHFVGYLMKNRCHFLRHLFFFSYLCFKNFCWFPYGVFLLTNIFINTGSSERTMSKKVINIGETVKFKGIKVLQMLL